MDMLNIFSIHHIVGGLEPGALPHEESLWCRALRASDAAQSAVPTELQDSEVAPTRHEQEGQTR